MEIYDIESERNELEMYANLEGSEIGELCNMLLGIANLVVYASDSFHSALVQEIKEQLLMFKSKTKIVESERTEVIKYKELEWTFYIED